MSTDHLRLHGLMRDAEVILERMRAGDIEVRIRNAAGDDWIDLTRNEIVRHVRMVTICEEFLKRVSYEETPTDPKAGLMAEDYYRDPDCCPPWGPFKTKADARAWSAKNLPGMA